MLISLPFFFLFFFFNDTATTEIYTLSLHDALPISTDERRNRRPGARLDATLEVEVGRRAEEQRGHPVAGEPGAERRETVGGPDLRGAGGGTEMDADPRRAAGAAPHQEFPDLGLARRGGERAKPGLGPGGRNPERRQEPEILVDLMAPRRGKRQAVGEPDPAAGGVVADPPSRAPVAGGQRRLKRVGQEKGQIRAEGPDGLEGAEAPRPRPRIADPRVGQLLPGDEPGPRADGHGPIRRREAGTERAQERQRHDGVAEPV